MIERLRRTAPATLPTNPLTSAKRYAAFAAFQLTVVAGICFLPVALLLAQVGVTLPVEKLINASHTKYEEVAEPDAA